MSDRLSESDNLYPASNSLKRSQPASHINQSIKFVLDNMVHRTVMKKK